MRKRTRAPRFVEPDLSEAHEEIAISDIPKKLEDVEHRIRSDFDKCSDLVIRRLSLPGSLPCLAVYSRLLVDEHLWNSGVLQPLMSLEPDQLDESEESLERLSRVVASSMKPTITCNLQETVRCVVEGCTVLYIECRRSAFCFHVGSQLHRQLEEPATESIIRGPRIGFIEKIDINMALLRHQIRSPRLKMESLAIGNVSRTRVAIVYLEKFAPQSVIDEVRKRLSQVDLNSMISSGYIQELINDQPYSPFPLIQATERPDSVAGALVEGKVAVLCDGTPMTLVMPVTFWFGIQSAEDYYMSFIFATMLRWLRFLYAFLAMMLPGGFVAITTFHPEMIPTSLALSLAAAREIVPFPAMVETLLMEITFEALREAGIRLPRPVGQTISIVGALVIGQAAVQAGIISAPIIIIVAMTGIASFLLPHTAMSQAVSLLRFPMIILGGTMGLYGVMAGLITLLIHLSSLQSFGIPYLWPIAPFHRSGASDVFIRAPWKYLKTRQWHKEMEQELERGKP